MTPKRPALRYHGGKKMLAPWIISHFGPHETYCEPFGGAASVLLAKPRAKFEVYNDLNTEIVNFFQVLRDHAAEFERVVRLTPFAREEFYGSYEPCDDPIEKARRTVARSFMGHGSSAVLRNSSSGFRGRGRRSNTPAQVNWMNYADHIESLAARMRGVVIENIDAIDCLRKHDAADTLHYVDPPYMHGERNRRHRYEYELNEEQHAELATALHTLEGQIILSGYRTPLYDELYRDWLRIDKTVLDDASNQRTESIWLSQEPGQRILQFGG